MTKAVKLKYVLASSESGTWGDEAEGVQGTPVLRSTEINLAGFVDLTSPPALRSLNQHERYRTQLQRGDILVVRSSGSDLHLGKSGYVEQSGAGMSFSNFLQRLRFEHRCNSRFAWYFLNSSAAKQQIRKFSSTTTGLQNLSASVISELEIPLPPRKEQLSIVDFLDAETARIDRLTVAMHGHDDLLKKRRLRVLDSVGRVDPQPEKVRLGYFSLLVTSGSRGWSDYIADSGDFFFRSANLHADRIQPKLANTAYVQIPASVATEGQRAMIMGGDVLIGITGANAGWVCLADDTVAHGYVSQHVCLVRPDSSRLNSRWLALFAASPTVQSELMRSQYGGTKTQLSLPDVRAIRVPVLPVERQAQLALSVEREVKMLDHQRALRQRQLHLLAERRQALITAAVTGQFDVSTASGRNVTDGVSA